MSCIVCVSPISQIRSFNILKVWPIDFWDTEDQLMLLNYLLIFFAFKTQYWETIGIVKFASLTLRPMGYYSIGECTTKSMHLIDISYCHNCLVNFFAFISNALHIPILLSECALIRLCKLRFWRTRKKNTGSCSFFGNILQLHISCVCVCASMSMGIHFTLVVYRHTW